MPDNGQFCDYTIVTKMIGLVVRINRELPGLEECAESPFPSSIRVIKNV